MLDVLWMLMMMPEMPGPKSGAPGSETMRPVEGGEAARPEGRSRRPPSRPVGLKPRDV